MWGFQVLAIVLVLLYDAVFEGNGHTIKNLYSRIMTNSGGSAGLFKHAAMRSFIVNVGVINANLYGGGGADTIGALVGSTFGSIIAAMPMLT